MSLQITAVATLHVTRGSFSAETREGQLLVPVVIANVLKELKVRTAEDLLSRTRSFPTSVATALGWSVEDVTCARAELILLLSGSGLVRQTFLTPEAPPVVALGARAPADARVKPGEASPSSPESSDDG